MNEIDPSKYEKFIKKNNKSNNEIKKYVINLCSRVLIVFVILITMAIIYKSNNNLKDRISDYFLKEDISFTKINKIYNKYLGGLLPIKNDGEILQVFDEKLSYSDTSIYYDGVKLSVSDNYLVPILDEGMVVFIGNKEYYGNTVIIENLDGVEYWYGNINNTSLKLYDYVEKGNLVGEVNDELYMVFSMDGKYLNYEDYIF